jgi:RimJ/RimL family protein N-acetyltransferase
MNEEDIPNVVSFLDGTSEDFMNQWGGGRWYKYPVTVEQVINQFHARIENTLYFVTVNNDNNEIVGSAELDFIDWENKTCAVCRYLIAEKHRNKGFGTEALKKLVKYAFDELNMTCVRLSVFDFNTGAQKCYAKAGFVEYKRETRNNGWVAICMEINNPNN